VLRAGPSTTLSACHARIAFAGSGAGQLGHGSGAFVVTYDGIAPKVTAGTQAPWVGYTCSGNTLTLIEPSPGGTWSMSRVS
jgi:hypothetical protein